MRRVDACDLQLTIAKLKQFARAAITYRSDETSRHKMYWELCLLQNSSQSKIVGDCSLPLGRYQQLLKCCPANCSRPTPTEVLIVAGAQCRSDRPIPHRTELRSE